MLLNYSQSLIDFWRTAPDQPGFKHVYAASFSAFMYLLQEAGTRSITINYATMNGLLKLSEEAYQESIKWLDEVGLIVYFKGKNRHTRATIFVNVPELAPSVVTESENLSTGISVSKGGAKGVSSQVLGGVLVVDSPFSPPPHPPIEVNNIITNQQAGQASGPVEATSLKKPKNIVLTDDEESDLLTAYGADVASRALMLVSVYKRKQGGTLISSDFTNCVKWAIAEVRTVDANLGNISTTRPVPGFPAPHSHTATPTRKFFREIT